MTNRGCAAPRRRPVVLYACMRAHYGMPQRYTKPAHPYLPRGDAARRATIARPRQHWLRRERASRARRQALRATLVQKPPEGGSRARPAWRAARLRCMAWEPERAQAAQLSPAQLRCAATCCTAALRAAAHVPRRPAALVRRQIARRARVRACVPRARLACSNGLAEDHRRQRRRSPAQALRAGTAAAASTAQRVELVQKLPEGGSRARPAWRAARLRCMTWEPP